MSHDDLLFYLFYVLLIGGAAVGFILLILWHILHFMLCRKYDHIIFKEPYFRKTELLIYTSWPLSLFRSMGYILLLALPGPMKRGRFKGLTLETENEVMLTFISRLFLLLLVLLVLFSISILVWGIVEVFSKPAY